MGVGEKTGQVNPVSDIVFACLGKNKVMFGTGADDNETRVKVARCLGEYANKTAQVFLGPQP